MVRGSSLLKHKLIFVSGKGGVGKTFFSASLASYAAKEGKKVLIVEHSIVEQIPPLFSYNSPVGHHETKLQENIYCINLDAKDCFREYVSEYLNMPRLYKNIFKKKLVKSFLDAIPGLNETMLLGRLYYTCKARRSGLDYDLVIFDAPASGHFYQLINTPSAIFSSGLIGPLVKEVAKVETFLKGSECAVYLLSLPEALVSSETLEFIPKLVKESPVKLKGVFLNRTYSDEIVEKFQSNIKDGLLNIETDKIVSYLQAKISQIMREQESFISSLKSLDLEIDYDLLPELGAIKEPLSPELISRFLGEGT